MLYGYRIPANIAWTVHGSGAAIATDLRLDNGQPSEESIITWLDESAPSSSDYVDLRADWAAPQAVRIIAVHGLSCGPGVRIDITGRRAEDGGYTFALGGNSASQRTVQLPDGRADHIVVADAGLDPLIGIQLRIYNDRGGVTWADAATDLRIGEARPWSAVTLLGKAGWKRGYSDPSDHEATASGGEHTWERAGWRTLAIDMSARETAAVRAGALAQGEDWETIEALSHGRTRAIVIVRRNTPSEIHRTAIFGRPTWSEIGHIVGPVHGSSLRMREVR